MNRAAIEAELPVAVREWLRRHASARIWHAIGRDLALEVAAALLTGNGEAGVNDEIHRQLLRHRSRAVRGLAGSAVRGRKWYMQPVAKRVAAHFGLSGDWLYQQCRRARKLGRSSFPSPPIIRSAAAAVPVHAGGEEHEPHPEGQLR